MDGKKFRGLGLILNHLKTGFFISILDGFILVFIMKHQPGYTVRIWGGFGQVRPHILLYGRRMKIHTVM